MSSPQTLVIDEPYFKDGLKQVADKLGFKNYTINADSGVADGVNYLGEIQRLNMEETVNGETRKLYLIGKTLTNNEQKRNFLNLNNMAITECHIYNNVFPAFDSLQAKFRVADKFSNPTTHWATAKEYEELILMEDLSKLDPPFCLPRNGKTLDYDHAKLILETLGHFHALSFALKHHHPDSFKEFAKVANIDQLNTEVNLMLPQIVQNTYDVGLEKHPEAKNILECLMVGIYDKSNKLLLEPDEHSVICHGDVWSFNLLYSYKDDTPNEVVLIDWQTIKHSSPVMDLLFCIFICVEEKTRETHLHSFLTIYYDSLKHHLAELQCVPNEIYSEDVFRSHIKKYIPSVIVHCFMMFPVFMGENFDMDSFVAMDQDKPIIPIMKYSDMFYSRFQQMAKDIERLLSM